MNSTSFLNTQLISIFERFRNAIIKYEYKHGRNTHLIELSPLEIFENKDYMEMEIDLMEKFNLQFPSEQLVFVSTNSLNKVTNPSLILKQRTMSICFKNNEIVTEPIFNFNQHFISKVNENDYASAA